MKSLRKYYYILLGLYLVAFIVGSFLDLQVAQSIYDKGNGFATFIGALGLLPGCMILSFGGGVFVSCAIRNKDRKVLFIILLILGIIFTISGPFFGYGDCFGPNGYDLPQYKYLGLSFYIPLALASSFLGYFLTRKCTNKDNWIPFLVFTIFMCIALLAAVVGIKDIVHRPRFRIVVNEGYEPFHNWWQRCSNYLEIIETHPDITKEEFKSFPSGHAAMSMLVLVFGMYLPLLGDNLKKVQLPVMIVGFVYNVICCINRMVIGAHFLSDVSMGSLFVLIFGFAFNEVLINHKKLHEIAKIE